MVLLNARPMTPQSPADAEARREARSRHGQEGDAAMASVRIRLDRLARRLVGLARVNFRS
jgi:hypothetical protein